MSLMSPSDSRATEVRCQVHVRVPGLDRDGHDRFHDALHRTDRRLGVITRGVQEFNLLTRESDERDARAYAERVLAEAAKRAGMSRDLHSRIAIGQIVSRPYDPTGTPRAVDPPSGDYQAIQMAQGGELHAMHEGPLGDWVVYLAGDPRAAIAGRDLLSVISELFELPHGRKPSWVYEAIERLAGQRTELGIRYACPCCDFLTLTEPPSGTYALCPVCWWEDDPIQFQNPDYAGGANPPSLREARKTFRRLGVSKPHHRDRARPPLPAERPRVA